MPYRFIEAVATADIAFEAWGSTLEEMFVAAAEATLNVMVDDLAAVAPHETVKIVLENDAVDMLLFDFLGELVYLKDTRRLLLRVQEIAIREAGGGLELSVTLSGEEIDPGRHPLNVDVKAVTLHMFEVTETDGKWKATAVLDI